MMKRLIPMSILVFLFFLQGATSYPLQGGKRLQFHRQRRRVQSIEMTSEAVLISQPNPSASSSPRSSKLQRPYRLLSLLAPVCMGAFWGRYDLLRLPSLLLTAKSFDILQSAARRRRLDATTFKFLNLGNFLSLGYIAALEFVDVGRGGALYTTDKMALRAVALLGALTCEFGLLKYGLPSMKLVGSNLLSLMYMVCAVLATYSVVDFSALLGIGDPIQAFMFPSVLLALSGAAIAGDKRLASDTYKSLNLTMLLIVISRLGMDLVGLVSIATQHQLSYLFTALTTFTCLFGYYKGNAFGKDGPVLLKAFNND